MSYFTKGTITINGFTGTAPGLKEIRSVLPKIDEDGNEHYPLEIDWDIEVVFRDGLIIEWRPKEQRSAFTLVELLVVIAIIGVLVALLMAAVVKAVNQADVVRTRSDISQLQQAIAAWQVKFGIQGPFPSRLKLWKRFGNYDQSQLDQDSLAFLQRVWPRLVSNGQFAAEASRVDWDGSLKEQAQPITLQGQECLVFFLGGVPASGATPGCTGWATSPTDPSYHVKHPGSGVTPPFFSFDSSRLTIGQSGTFLHYLDAYEKAPYAYFSSYKTRNGYNRYLTTHASDCASLGVWPYAEAQGQYMNPDTFQIISAGRDGLFGGGTNPVNWSPLFTKGNVIYSLGVPGYDDMSNFHDKFLGIPPD